MPRESFFIADVDVSPRTRATVSIPLPKLNSRTDLDLPVHVIHGRNTGPSMFVSAAAHGDELNGVEVCQRLLDYRGLQRIRGTLPSRNRSFM